MRVFHKNVLTLCAAIAAAAGVCSPVSAQSADEWYGSDPAPRYPRPYNDDRYDPADDDQASADPRENQPRYDQPAYGQQRYYGDPRDDRYDAPGRYVNPSYSASPDAGPGPRADRGFYDDRDVGYGAWDATPSPSDEDRLSKTPGKEAGGKPLIQAVAPPVVAFNGPYAAGSIVIDTGGRKLYYVINTTSAYAYPIAVGRQGFTWTGKEKVSRVVDWPDWYPPADMRQRKPELPERMLGGVNNPLGAKAIYLGNTLYRIHGTNEPKSIGKAESSGCFRMLNENVLHLASLVKVGTEVNVVRSLNGAVVASAGKPPADAKSSQPKRITERLRPPYAYDNRSYDPRYDNRPYYPPYADDWRY